MSSCLICLSTFLLLCENTPGEPWELQNTGVVCRRARCTQVTTLATVSALEMLHSHDPNGGTASVPAAPLHAEGQEKPARLLGIFTWMGRSKNAGVALPLGAGRKLWAMLAGVQGMRSARIRKCL